MWVFVAFVFFLVTASAYRDDDVNTKYFIKNALTKMYLYVNHSGTSKTRNAYIWDFPDTLPESQIDATFFVVKNDALGPYYNIIGVGCGCTLFASEFTIASVLKNTVNIVMAWAARDHLNTPEATWNVRYFQNDMYILNVHYGAYLYDTYEVESPIIVDKDKRYSVLMPSDGGGRVQGTQWLLVKEKSAGLKSRMGDLVEGGGPTNMTDKGNVSKGRMGDLVAEDGEPTTVTDEGKVLKDMLDDLVGGEPTNMTIKGNFSNGRMGDLVMEDGGPTNTTDKENTSGGMDVTEEEEIKEESKDEPIEKKRSGGHVTFAGEMDDDVGEDKVVTSIVGGEKTEEKTGKPADRDTAGRDKEKKLEGEEKKGKK